MKKYELLEREENGLCRVRALKNFGDVKKGDIGGYIEREQNLSQLGNAWVYDDAWVYDNAKVSGNAEVSGNAKVYDDAWVSGYARVSGNAWVYGDAWVSGNAKVYDDAWVYDNARVYDDAEVSGNARVYDNAWVYGDAEVYTGRISSDISEPYTKILGIQTPTRLITIYKDVEGVQKCNIGCQQGMTLEQLEQRIIDDGGMKPHRQIYLDLMRSIKL